MLFVYLATSQKLFGNQLRDEHVSPSTAWRALRLRLKGPREAVGHLVDASRTGVVVFRFFFFSFFRRRTGGGMRFKTRV